MILTTMRDLSRLIHKRRVQLDPAYRGELVRLFENPRARMAYFSKHGLRIDDLGEAIHDAGFTVSRPTCDEVLQLLEALFAPGPVRASMGKVEAKGILAEAYAGIERELQVRRGNRWRSWECSCFITAKIRTTKDELPPAMARAICDDCGQPWTLRTIKLDLSNRSLPMTVEECVQ